MAKPVIKWKSSSFALDRYADGVLPIVQSAADRIADECGAGYVATTAEQGRWGGGRVVVLTRDYEAMLSEAKQHNLARYGGR